MYYAARQYIPVIWLNSSTLSWGPHSVVVSLLDSHSSISLCYLYGQGTLTWMCFSREHSRFHVSSKCRVLQPLTPAPLVLEGTSSRHWWGDLPLTVIPSATGTPLIHTKYIVHEIPFCHWTPLPKTSPISGRNSWGLFSSKLFYF